MKKYKPYAKRSSSLDLFFDGIIPPIDKSKYLEDSFWKDNIKVAEYPDHYNPKETIQFTYINLKYGES